MRQVHARVAPIDVAPAFNTPANTVRRLEWAVNQRDLETVAGLLAADLICEAQALDSAGNVVRQPRDRAWVLEALRSLFEGVPGRYEPAQVTLDLDRDLIAFPDTRAGSSPVHRRTVRTSMGLRVRDPSTSSTFEVRGYLLFYAVRGDSAAIPSDQVAESGVSDSTRWWIDRVEDETLTAEPSPPRTSAHPARSWSLSSLLEYYRVRAIP